MLLPTDSYSPPGRCVSTRIPSTRISTYSERVGFEFPFCGVNSQRFRDLRSSATALRGRNERTRHARNSLDSLWSVDLFRCESLIPISHWVMVVMDLFTRRIIGYAVCAGAPVGGRAVAAGSINFPLRPKH